MAKARGSFHIAIAFLAIAAVTYGFSHTVGDNLFHPTPARPAILYVHAAVFTSWLALFTLQASLVRFGQVRWHRRIGALGIALGALIPIVGIATAITMSRFDIATLGAPSADVESGLIIPVFDMICFTTTFTLAIRWRRQPDRHRRLMVIATCALTAAGFGRFPPTILPPYLFYAGVDALILLGVIHDLVTERRVHRVYLCALPALMVGQAIVTYTAFNGLGWWHAIAHPLLGL